MTGSQPEGGSSSPSESHGEGAGGPSGEHRAEGERRPEGEPSGGGEHGGEHREGAHAAGGEPHGGDGHREGGHQGGGEHGGGEHREGAQAGGEHRDGAHAGGEHHGGGGHGGGEHREGAHASGEHGGGEHREGAHAGGEDGGGTPQGEQRAEGAHAGGGEHGEGGPPGGGEHRPEGEHRAEGGEPSQEGAPQDESREGGEAAEDGDESAELPEGLSAPEERLAGRVTTVLLPLEKLEDDVSFRLRPEGDVSGLATDLARLGQLFPVDVRPRGEDRYQLICGFRRVAALRFLKRDAVQARVHTDLSDEDALLMSLAEAIHASPVEPEVLEAKRDELESEGRLSAAVRDMLEKALATEDTLAPEGVEEEVDADELAADVAQRLGQINQDLSLLADVFAALDDSRKAELLMQLRYSSELVAYLEGL